MPGTFARRMESCCKSVCCSRVQGFEATDGSCWRLHYSQGLSPKSYHKERGSKLAAMVDAP